MSIKEQDVAMDAAGSEFDRIVNRLKEALTPLSKMPTQGGWNRLVNPDWPFTREGFRHKYKCTICGKVIE